MKNRRLIAIITLILAVTMLLSSCGSASVREDVEPYYPTEKDTEMTVDEKSSFSSVSDGQKMIKNGRLSAETKDLAKTYDDIVNVLSDLGGYVESTSVSSSGSSLYDKTGSYVFRVPAESFDSFIEKVKEICNVTSESTSSDDVSAPYYDAKSMLDALAKEEERLLEMLEKADSLDYMIQIEDKLAQIRYEIENYNSIIKGYDGKINYSTVSVSIWQVAEFSEPEPDSFGDRLLAALAGGWNAFVDVCSGALIVLVAVLPFLIASGVAAGIVLLIVFLAKKKKAKKK